MSNYFNTTAEAPEDVQEFSKVNANQNRLIYFILKSNNRPMNCYEIEQELQSQGKGILLTSIRRSLTCMAQRYEGQRIEKAGKSMGKNGRYVINYVAV